MVSLELIFTRSYCTGADTKGETIIAAVGDLHTNELRSSLITILQLVLPCSMNCMIPIVFNVTMEGISVPVVTAKGVVVKAKLPSDDEGRNTMRSRILCSSLLGLCKALGNL